MQSIIDKDSGTPARSSGRTITLEVNGVSVTVPEGSSVMFVAFVGPIVLRAAQIRTQSDALTA